MVVQLPSCTTACTCDMEGWTLDAFLHMGIGARGGVGSWSRCIGG